MISIKVSLHKNLIFDKPTQKDLLMIQSLSEDPFYCYVFKETSKQNDFTDVLSSRCLESKASSNDPSKVFEYIIRDDSHAFIGYLQGYYPHNPQSLWLQRLLVNKPYLQQGYGIHIMNLFIHSLKANRFHQQLFLTCHKENNIGHKFWTKLGFHIIKDDIQQTHNLYCVNIRS